MTRLRIALLQLIPAGADQAANTAIAAAACRRAQVLGADVAVFPEMWNIGYTGFVPAGADYGDLWRGPAGWGPGQRPEISDQLGAARAAWQAQAEAEAGAYVTGFQALARELRLALAVTYLQAWPAASGPRNAVSLIDRHGQLAFTYAKVHTCDFDHLEAACTPGDAFPVAELDTAAGRVQIGAMICFDREFPESARLLMLGGAEIILIPNACEMEANRLGQLRARAFENMVGVALANYAAPHDNGHSAAYSPMVFDSAGRSRDTTVVEAGAEAGIYLADFDLAALRAYRAHEAMGDAFRRPHRYSALTAAEVRPPFARLNAAGAPYPRRQR